MSSLSALSSSSSRSPASSASSSLLPPLVSPKEFLLAAEKNDDATVASALHNPLLDPNVVDEDGKTALMAAVKLKHASVLKVLLADKRVDPNIADKYGRTPVTTATMNGDISMLRVLLADDRTIRIRSPNTVFNCEVFYSVALAWVNRAVMVAEGAPEEFFSAVVNGEDTIVASAMRNPLVDPNLTDEGGSNALIWATTCDQVSTVKVLLADKRVDPNIANQDGYTALTVASLYSRREIMELLLADHRTIRAPRDHHLGYFYDLALRAVKQRRNARFKGLARAMVAFRRLRLRAAQAAYAPGGAGFATAAASFNAALAVVSQ